MPESPRSQARACAGCRALFVEDGKTDMGHGLCSVVSCTLTLLHDNLADMASGGCDNNQIITNLTPTKELSPVASVRFYGRAA